MKNYELNYTGICLSFKKKGGIKRIGLSGVYSLKETKEKGKEDLKITTNPLTVWGEVSVELFQIQGVVRKKDLGRIEKELKRSVGFQVGKGKVSVKMPQLVEKFMNLQQQQKLVDIGDVLYHFLMLSWKKKK